MTITIESLRPTTGELSIEIRMSSTVNVTAFSARQKVTGFVVDEISTNMHGAEPVLVLGDSIRWRVPVILSLPPRGDLGEVGAIDVDIATGQLQVDLLLIDEMIERANNLASRASSETTSE